MTTCGGPRESCKARVCTCHFRVPCVCAKSIVRAAPWAKPVEYLNEGDARIYIRVYLYTYLYTCVCISRRGMVVMMMVVRVPRIPREQVRAHVGTRGAHEKTSLAAFSRDCPELCVLYLQLLERPCTSLRIENSKLAYDLCNGHTACITLAMFSFLGLVQMISVLHFNN